MPSVSHHSCLFFLTSKASDAIYRADGSFDAPSAYHEFSVNTDLQHLVDYIMDTDIPSYFFLALFPAADPLDPGGWGRCSV